MISKKNKIWRLNFAVNNAQYHMITPNASDMTFYVADAFRGILREVICVQKGNDNIASYVPVAQLRALIDKTLDLIQSNPQLIAEIHHSTVKKCQDYFTYARSLLKVDFRKLSKEELISVYELLLYHQQGHHGFSIATTWFVDSDGEDFSKLLLDKVKKIVGGSRYEASDVFSILTTPNKISLAAQEEKESLEILKLIQADKEAKKIFNFDNVDNIEKKLLKINLGLRRKMLKHFKKWRWTPFTYTGPAYDLDYYLSIWSGWVKEDINIDVKIASFINYSHAVKSKKEKIIKSLHINKNDQSLFKIAEDIIYLKAYRKDALYFGMYVLDGLLREIAIRLQLSLQQVRFMAFWEIPQAIRDGYFSEKVLNDRRNFSVFYQKDDKGVIYTGVSAKKFLAKLKLEKVKVKSASEIVGTVACPGMAKGIIKIINNPNEMSKMDKGNIMVAHTTYPALVPAMKKAAAIITDDGGITCHAAIVSRELNIPCIVGTKTVTKVLHDGDFVHVDAGRGIVKIIKK